MRAVIAGAAPVAGSATLLAELASAHDVTIAADGGAALFTMAGLVPTFVVGDLDSLTPASAATLERKGARLVTHPADKDATDLELAIHIAAEQGCASVTVTAAFSGRLDHTLASVGALAHAPLLCDIAEPGLNGWLLRAEDRSEIALCGAGATVSVLPLLGEAGVSCTGVRWTLDRATLPALGGWGVSNIVTSATATVRIHSGIALVISPRIGMVDPARAEG